MDERLNKQLDFILDADKVKNIMRQTYLADGKRKENDAEHSWQLALMAVLLKEYAPEEIQEAINRLTARHYLDDTDLCQRQYQAYINEKHRSIKAIKYKLMEKGFSQNDIQNAQEETDIDDIDYEYTVCLRLLNSRYTPSKADKLKCQGYLYRKGFNYSAIRLAIEDFFYNP